MLLHYTKTKPNPRRPLAFPHTVVHHPEMHHVVYPGDACFQPFRSISSYLTKLPAAA